MRALRARDIERLENTSFAVISPGGVAEGAGATETSGCSQECPTTCCAPTCDCGPGPITELIQDIVNPRTSTCTAPTAIEFR